MVLRAFAKSGTCTYPCVQTSKAWFAEEDVLFGGPAMRGRGRTLFEAALSSLEQDDMYAASSWTQFNGFLHWERHN